MKDQRGGEGQRGKGHHCGVIIHRPERENGAAGNTANRMTAAMNGITETRPAPAPQGTEDGVRAARAGTAQGDVSMYNDYALHLLHRIRERPLPDLGKTIPVLAGIVGARYALGPPCAAPTCAGPR